MFEEIRRLQDEPPSADELRKTKAYLIGNFPMDRETPFQMASELLLLAINNLPETFFEQELRSMAQTADADCTRVVTEVVKPDKMVVVVVGNAKELKEGLEKIAPVTVIEAKE